MKRFFATVLALRDPVSRSHIVTEGRRIAPAGRSQTNTGVLQYKKRDALMATDTRMRVLSGPYTRDGRVTVDVEVVDAAAQVDRGDGS